MKLALTLFTALLLSPLAVTSAAVDEKPYAPKVELSNEPVNARPPTYVPAQTVAAFPERLLPSYQKIAVGIKELAPDTFTPVDGGIALVAGKKGSFELNHRRAGVVCHENLVLRLRLEMVRDLATLRLALRKGERFAWLSELPLKQFVYYPGRAVYELEDPGLQLAVTVEVVSPAATPAYGFLARVTVSNRSDDEARVQLLALGSSGNAAPTAPSTKPATADHLVLDCAKAAATLKPSIPYNMALQVLAAWDGGTAAGATANAVTRVMALAPRGTATAQLTVFMDSPGYDETAVHAQIEHFFQRHDDHPEAARARMTGEALDTFVRILVDGDLRFAEVRDDHGKSLAANLKAWSNGVYREAPVRFEMSDQKMESLANLVASDFFPGVVQPPGIVTASKGGDKWNYALCYRHVHAASDIGLEHRALDYLNLLSLNRKPDGRVASLLADFKGDAHPTLFEESFIDSVWHHYKWTGDLAAVRRLWPTLTGAAAWMDKNLDPDGDNLYKDTLHQWKSDYDNRGPSSAFQTALVRRAYADLAELATKLGHTDQAEKYAAKAGAIRAAAQQELWSNEFGVLGSKCPLGLLRLHPQCLDVDIPIWTGLTDANQSVMLADWYLNNASFTDKQGGRYFYDNDWWPMVFSNHLPAQGDMMMSAWGLMLSGRHEEGARSLATAAAMCYRGPTPGFAAVFDSKGVAAGGDKVTCQGAFLRALVEGVFGITPNLDEGRIIVHPRFPADWNHARFTRPGLDLAWRRNGNEQTFRATTAANVRCRFEIPVNSTTTSVTLDGKPVKPTMTPGMGWAVLDIETGNGGGELKLITTPREWRIDAPVSLEPGRTAELKLSGLSATEIEDPYGFFEVLQKSADRATVGLKRAGSGQATLFVRCTTGGAEGSITWIEPITLLTLPRSVKEATKQTVLEPVPEDSKLRTLDLSAAYNDSIQTCFLHPWKSDAAKAPSPQIKFWTMPLFRLTAPLPREVIVGKIPFLLGDMKSDLTGKNLILLDNTPPRQMDTTATLHLGGRTLHKAYLLSLNMNLPMKAYTPAATVTVRYTDGSQQVTELIPPVNFDCYFQDFAINTVAMPLTNAVPGHGQKKWANAHCDLDQMHLTMTDVLCDPVKKVDRIEFRSVATETFLGIAGVTLLEAAPTGK